jgi:hypothetical protein
MKKKHFAGKSRRVPLSSCIGCGRRVDASTPIDHASAKPDPGDITVCFYCGHIMAYAEDLSLRNLTDAEMHAVAGNEAVLAIMRARGRMMARKQ